MKNKITTILLTTALAFSSNCSSSSEGDNSALAALLLMGTSTAQTLSGNITTDTTIADGTILTGIVRVKSGATVTINAGSTVYGDTGSALFIEQGAKINASGTATSPIVMTSAKTAGNQAPGDWGGVVLVGAAPADQSALTEGGVDITYGTGSSTADNSGTMQYVRIEYAGNEVAPGDELNCLSVYSVGSATTINHIQCHMGRDDSFEFFGGNVTASYLLSTAAGDDDFDADNGAVLNLQYLIGHKYPATCGVTLSADPRGFENDGTPSGAIASTRTSSLTVSDFTILGSGVTTKEGLKLREGVAGTWSNGLVYGFGKNFDISGVVGGQTTAVTINNTVFGESGKAGSFNTTDTNYGSSASNMQETLAALPVTSAGIDCGVTTPDYSPTTAQAGGYGSADWYTGWTRFTN